MKKTYQKDAYGCADIDDCAVDRCDNDGTCVNAKGVVDGWSCKCKTNGRTGESLYVEGGKGKCTEDINECELDTDNCDDNATCNNEQGGTEGFTCACNEHWASVEKDDEAKIGRECLDINDCEADQPCKNEGVCYEGQPGCVDESTKNPVACYTCKCYVGWSGDNCDKDENECKTSEQGHTKKLHKTAAGVVERDGGTPLAPCSKQIMERTNNLNSASCVNTAGSFGCRCNLGWTGDGLTCVDADDCEFSPCAHAGTCADCGTLCFSCDCVVGWRGTTCGTDWNECLMGIHRCDDAATCVNTPGSYTCKCDPGYTGNGVGAQLLEKITFTTDGVTKTTHVQHGCADIDDCDANEYDGTGRVPGWDKTWNDGPCQYGSCEDVGAGAYHCTCWDGWTDSNCDNNIDECDSKTGVSLCSSSATCFDLPGKGDPTTVAAVNTGADCGAATSPFKTSGRCRLAGMGNKRRNAKCTDKSAAKCKKEECCEKATNYMCKCNEGFEGDGFSCQDKQDCKEGACSGHGFCSDLGVDQFKCACDAGWEDADCGKNVNECSSFTHECGDKAQCVDTVGSYYCKCPLGFVDAGAQIDKGQECVDIDDCAVNEATGNNICGVNSISCTDGGRAPGLFTCFCKKGWTDYKCDYDVNECIGSHGCWSGGKSHEEHHTVLGEMPEFEGATCLNTPGSYECQCPKGMIGQGRATDKAENILDDFDHQLGDDVGEGMKNMLNKDGSEKEVTGAASVHKLPTGCVDYDDCNSAGADKIPGTRDVGEGPELDKCGKSKRGTCQDTGSKSFRCDCDPGYGCGSAGCENDCNECSEENPTHQCSEHADCKNTLGSYECSCNSPSGVNGAGFFGTAEGKACFPCTVCEEGFLPKGNCKTTDRECVDIDECETNTDGCSLNSQCTNSVGSFTCECQPGYFAELNTGTGLYDARSSDVGASTCSECTVCYEGFHIDEPCTSSSDTVCERDVKDNAKVIIKSEADETLQCLTIDPKSWFPSRVDYGGGGQCGASSKEQWKKLQPKVLWSFTALGENTKKSSGMGQSNLYLIRYGGNDGKCLFFGGRGEDQYPSLQHCQDYDVAADCPWANHEAKYCGFRATEEGPGGRKGLLKDRTAVWKVTTLKLSEDKFLLQSAAKVLKTYECLAFEKQGTAINPSRYNWGNGEEMCGVGQWSSPGKSLALMNNKQAVFILESHIDFQHSQLQYVKHQAFLNARREITTPELSEEEFKAQYVSDSK